MVPLIIVTGFLGSGKTSLLVEVMKQRAARGTATRIGLLVNELGAVGVDGEILSDGVTQQVELPGGCVCCALNDDFANSVVALLDGAEAEGRPLAGLILETTGVAEPLPLAWATERAPLAGRVQVAAVVTVIDALNFERGQTLSDAFEAQIAYADVLVLRKGELVSDDVKAHVRARAMALAGKAWWIDASHQDAAAYVRALLDEADPDRRTGALATTAHGHVHDEHCGHDCEAHPPVIGQAHQITSLAFALPGTPLELADIEAVLAEMPDEVFRAKGVALIRDGGAPQWMVFHQVGARFGCEVLAQAAAPTARLVVLGTALTSSTLAPLVAKLGHA